MDFEPTAEATEAAGLAATILTDHCTPDRLRVVDAEAGRFDLELWTALADAGLLALVVPEDHDGSGLGLVELCAVLVEVVCELPGIGAWTSRASTGACSYS